MAQAFGIPYVYSTTKTWAQVQSAGFQGLIDEILTNQAATANPTVAPTATATGGGASGGLLAAGTYYLVYSETNGLGETALSPQSTQLTVGATNIPRVTFPALQTNNVARNLYIGAVNGPSGGPYRLYDANITTTTHDMNTAMPTDSTAVAAPTANTTAPDLKAKELLRAVRNGRLGDVFKYATSTLSNFDQGDATDWRQTQLAVQRAQWVFRAAERTLAYVGQKMMDNPGTITNQTYGLGQQRKVRTWP